MNEVYDGFFTRDTGPARATVAVAQLPNPRLLVEMKAIAMLPSGAAKSC
jgi:2-aminomuconate deaminase